MERSGSFSRKWRDRSLPYPRDYSSQGTPLEIPSAKMRGALNAYGFLGQLHNYYAWNWHEVGLFTKFVRKVNSSSLNDEITLKSNSYSTPTS